MILKGNQRANGADLAVHLMNGADNERIEIAQIHGAVAGDLLGAFAEFEAVASGTKARDYLYSLSINPPSKLTRAQYFEAIDAIENRLGLTGQPRAIVFHVKDGREHCHVIWSRIDVAHMKAIHMAHDRRRLMDLACELAHKYGLDLPPGLKAWEAKQKFEKEKLEPTLAEKAQAQATGISPEQRRAEITQAYERSDSAESFVHALEQKGYVLARGDRRGLVVVDKFGAPHSLTRYIKGHKAKDIKRKLSALDPARLPGVDQAKELQRRRQRALEEREGEKGRGAAQARRKKATEALAARQAQRRAQLLKTEQELLTRQQVENLSLHAAQLSESKGLAFRLRSAVAELIGRTPGLRSVLGPLQKLSHLDPRERHRLESMALARRHGRERMDIERLRRLHARLETREARAMERALVREERALHELDGRAQHDFTQAARQDQSSQTGDGDLSVKFNDAAEFVEGAHRAGGDDDDERRPSWKDDAESTDRGHRPGPGRGYGYRRDSD